MKKLLGFWASALALSLPLVPAFGQTAAESAPAAEPEYTPEQMIETWGWFLGQQIGLSSLGLDESEVRALARGMHAAGQGREAPFELERIAPSLEQFLNNRAETVRERQAERGQAETKAFFADLDKKPNIQQHESGLRYEIISKGEGRSPLPSNQVRVHYEGRLLNDTVFDSSRRRGEPAEFLLSQVIPGWTIGLQLIAPGGQIRLYIPPELAYGEDGRPGIPPSSTLVFEVELLEVSDAPAMPEMTLPFQMQQQPE
jgi:FKBP-type peptidyl-prolyl cis-trans isomerase